MGWMEEKAMEKTWDVFWQTGKVTDYLNYCTDKMENEEPAGRKTKKYVTTGGTDRHCFNGYADRRI